MVKNFNTKVSLFLSGLTDIFLVVIVVIKSNNLIKNMFCLSDVIELLAAIKLDIFELGLMVEDDG